jgi:hypothetical protein
MKKAVNLACTGLALAAASPAANAAILLGNATNPPGGTFMLLPNPATLNNIGDRTSQLNGLNQLNLYGFDEALDVTLASGLTVNLGGALGNNTVLAAGTRVASHSIFFDPRGNGSMTASVTFNTRILGILRTTASQLATDTLFAPGLSFAPPAITLRGLENSDGVLAWAPGSQTVSINWAASNPGDTLRILTVAVPEPATWAMMITGFGLVGGALRKGHGRRANVRAKLRHT